MKSGPVLFGRHLLLERVALGGMAEVYLAKVLGAAGFERFVAVKRILPELSEDEAFVSMFVDEARIAAHLSHPNIVEIHELGLHEGAYFISMEFVSGRDLRQLVDRRHAAREAPGPSLEPRLACYVAARVADALDHAHRKRAPDGAPLGIIHRDVSPQNVLLSFDGEVKLCDFGIAKAATRAQRTEVGVLKGKFAYMSPEQVRQRTIDQRSDQFSLGIILWELLAGRRLFSRGTDYATIEAIRTAEVPPLAAPTPAGLEPVVRRMLARDPEARFATLAEVGTALAPFTPSPSDAAAELAGLLDGSFPGAKARELAALDTYGDVRPPPFEHEQETHADAVSLALGPHADAVALGPHADALSLGPHEDALSSGPHEDAVALGPHADALSSGPHEDALSSGPHADALPSGPHADALPSGPHADALPSGPHADALPSEAERVRAELEAVLRPRRAPSGARVEARLVDPEPTKAPPPVPAEPGGPVSAPNPEAPPPTRAPSPARPVSFAEPVLGGPPPTSLDATRATTRAEAVPRRPRRWMMAVGAAGVAAVGAALASFALDDGASLVIESEPPVPLEVRVDGELVPAARPARVEAIERGLHVVEVRAEGFETYTQTIRIGQGEEHTMQVRLRPEVSK